jgi:hypothetical protein
MSLLSVLQSEYAALVLGFLNNEYMELLEVARPVRNSLAFAWEISTYKNFTLTKVDANMRICEAMLCVVGCYHLI